MRYSKIEIGDTGLRQYSGYVREEFLRQLTGRRGAQVYREMRDNDAIIGAVMFAIEQIMRTVDWQVLPAEGDSPQAQDAADLLTTCLDDMERPWPEVITEVLTFLTYGWSLHEIVYRYRGTRYGSKFNDGRIGWRKIALRSQETLQRWEFTPHGEPVAFYQQPWSRAGIVRIPREKYILFRTTSNLNNPEGRSILRNAYRSWYFKKKIEEIEAIGLERDLTGLPVMRVPSQIMRSDADADEQALFGKLKQILFNVKRAEDEGLMLPSDADEDGNPLFQFELLSTGGRRQFDTNAIVTRYDQRIAQSMLADFIMLGHQSTGSFALSKDKTNVFTIAIEAFLRLIQSTVNHQAVGPLMELNGIAPEYWPRLKAGTPEQHSLKDIAAYVKDLVSSGAIMPDPNLDDFLRERADLPRASEEEDDDDALLESDGLTTLDPEEPTE